MIDNDPLDPRTAAFLDDLRAAYGSLPVEPDARLTALFAADAIAVLPTEPTSRRPRMLSDLLKSLPGKVAAGLVGATLAWSGLGVAGAMPGPLSLASSEDEISEPAPDETEVADETDADAEEGTDEEGAEDEGAEDETAPASDELPEAPTTVSEAAHIHDFDEACGNHGMYVSHYARFGEEPECAGQAREEAAAQDQADADEEGTDEVTIADESDDDSDEADDRGKGKKGKAKGKGGKGKGRR